MFCCCVDDADDIRNIRFALVGRTRVGDFFVVDIGRCGVALASLLLLLLLAIVVEDERVGIGEDARDEDSDSATRSSNSERLSA